MQGTTATYNINNLCSGIAQGTGYFDPGSIHTANMTGLTPVTRYYYIYGSDVSHLTLPRSWCLAPAISAGREPLFVLCWREACYMRLVSVVNRTLL